MNSNPHTLALARFPNLANVKVIVIFTITTIIQELKQNAQAINNNLCETGIGYYAKLCYFSDIVRKVKAFVSL